MTAGYKTLNKFQLTLLCLLTVAMGYLGTKMIIDGVNSEHWPSTEGTLLESRVAYHSRVARGSDSYYEVLVEYQYQVGNKIYISRTFSIAGENFPTQQDAEEALAKVKRANYVTVRYDPKNPARATLLTGVSGYLAVIWLTIAILSTYTGIQLMAYRAKQRGS